MPHGGLFSNVAPTVPHEPFSHYSRVVVNPARADEFLEIMRLDAAASLDENGCLAFVLVKMVHGVGAYGISSVWATSKDWVLHQRTEQYNRYATFSLSGGILFTATDDDAFVVHLGEGM